MTEKRVVIADSSVIVYDDIEIAKLEATRRVMGSLAPHVVVFKTKDGWYGSALREYDKGLPDGLTAEYFRTCEHTPSGGSVFSGWNRLYPRLSAAELLLRHSALLELAYTLLDADSALLAVNDLIDCMADALTQNVIVYGVLAADNGFGARNRDSRIEQVILRATHEQFDCRLLRADEPSHYVVDWVSDPWGFDLKVLVADEAHDATVVMTAEQYIFALYAQEKLP